MCCDLAVANRRTHAIEFGWQLRIRSKDEIQIHDRETDEVTLILADGRVQYGDEVPDPLTFEDIWPEPRP